MVSKIHVKNNGEGGRVHPNLMRRARCRIRAAFYWLLALDSRLLELVLGLCMIAFACGFINPAWQNSTGNPLKIAFDSVMPPLSWEGVMMGIGVIRIASILLERTVIRMWLAAGVGGWWIFMYWVFARSTQTSPSIFLLLLCAAASFWCFAHVWTYGETGGKGGTQ